MRKFIKPLIAVLAGMLTSWGLQAAGMEALTAKLIGVAVVIAVIAYWWRRGAVS